MSNRIGIVVGSVPLGEEKTILKELLSQKENQDVYVIAADGGIAFFLDEKIAPDEWIGDMDSAKEEYSRRVAGELGDISINSCSPIKDDTDTALALKRLTDGKKCREIYVFGGIGGKRFEHSMANIQLMHYYRERGVRIYMYSPESLLYVLMNETICYETDKKGYISVFSLTKSSKVDIKGLFYEYSGVLENTCPLGVSNEFNASRALIEVTEGAVLVVETR